MNSVLTSFARNRQNFPTFIAGIFFSRAIIRTVSGFKRKYLAVSSTVHSGSVVLELMEVGATSSLSFEMCFLISINNSLSTKQSLGCFYSFMIDK
jgi:hypothetical protein